MALGTEVVNFIRLHLLDYPDQVGAVSEIAVMQRKPSFQLVGVLVEVVDAGRIEATGAAFDAMHAVTLPQQQLSKVRAVLASDASDQGCFHADTSLLNIVPHIRDCLHPSTTEHLARLAWATTSNEPRFHGDSVLASSLVLAWSSFIEDSGSRGVNYKANCIDVAPVSSFFDEHGRPYFYKKNTLLKILRDWAILIKSLWNSCAS